MIKVNSVSGGKTSAYMAIHYPTDFNVFSLVTIEAKYCTPRDKNLVQYVSDKIGKEFIATAESDKTLIVVRELEQQLGRSIYWVAGDTFEQVIRKKKALPNQMWRFCTTEMKMKPIFEFCQNRIKEVVEMNIGFRYDEQERGERNKTNTHFKAIVGQSENGRNKWKEIYWRELSFPMIDDRTTHLKVKKWADQSSLIFPEDSNCVGCFWKPFQQLRKNWNDEPLKMKWFSEMEKELGRTFKKEMSYLKTKKLGIQQDFNFGTGSGCSAGYCTD